MPQLKRYPKPGPVGGKLIRDVVKTLREQGLELPLASDLLVACSGGPDSVALAHLLARYGRRIVPRSKIRLLHVNHGWRGKESDGDEHFVRDLARSLKVRVSIKRMKPPEPGSGESWEDIARKQRKEVFAHFSSRHSAPVFTAHQADDLAETVLWRILTGQAKTHSGGIAFRHGVEVRPLLRVRKKDLKLYLKEEGQEWREDSTNLSSRFLRARLRLELMPIVEHIFPRAVDHLCELAWSVQSLSPAPNAAPAEISELPRDSSSASDAYRLLFGAAGLLPRRPHWEFLATKLKTQPGWSGQVSLPGGWRLTREKKRKPQQLSEQMSDPVTGQWIERWILEKGKSSEL